MPIVIPLKDKPGKKPRFRIVITGSQMVVIALALFTGFVWHWYASSAGIVRADRTFLLSLHGVVLKIPDRETMPLPYSYESPEEKSKKLPKIRAFTLCARLPKFSLHGDIESRKKCLFPGTGAGEQVMLGIEDRNVQYPATYENLLARTLIWKISRHENNLRNWRAYVAGDDKYGLHSYIPTKNIEKSTPSIFWSGLDIEHVNTVIECRGYLVFQNASLKECIHKFLFPKEEFGDGVIEVKLYYRHEWLPEWRTIEKNAIQAIRSLRLNKATSE